MRNTVTIGIAALLLASATVANAQGQPQQQQQNVPPQAPVTAPVAPELGLVDLGVRATSTTGDKARYERYSDLKDGAVSQILFGKKTETFSFAARAYNVGYRDQSYVADYNSGRIKVIGLFDSTPLNYFYQAATPWVQAGTSPTATFTLDPSARLAVQSKTPGIVGIPTSAAQLNTPSIYRGLATQFEMQQLRTVGGGGLTYNATPDMNINLTFASTKKSGTMPWAGAFAFNNANELPLPLDNRSNDVSVGAEWATQKGMVRVGWTGSWFDNKIHDLVWDNPIRATDFSNGLAITNPPCQSGVAMGPYDCSGYSNGNGPAQGRMSMPPDSSMNVVSATGLYKMPAHTSVNATLSFSSMKQNDALIPWTINPVIASPTVYSVFHDLAHLERNTAKAEVRGVNALVNFNSRPNRWVSLNMRYRYNNHDNRTPAFEAVEYVRFDAVPEETGGETEAFDITRKTLDVNATFNIAPYTALRLGYGNDSFDRTGRSFSDMTDDIFRVSIDTMRSQYVTLRGIYTHTIRKGSGFSEDTIVHGGGQPNLRFYDEADSKRNRGTVLVILTPMSGVDLTTSFAKGEDVYNGEGHEFGLLSNDNSSINVGLNIAPKETVAFGVNFGRDKFQSMQKSRNANPLPDVQFNDPARDWTLDNDETVNSFDIYLDLSRAIKNTDISLNYDFSDSDNAFIHGGSRISSLIAAGTFLALPDVTNKWRRVSADVKYFFQPKVGIGLGWWYEKLDVSDFNTIDLTPGTPRINYLGEISTGYGNRPYKGNTGFVRLLYRF